MKLIASWVENENVDNKNLDEMEKKIIKVDDAISIVSQYETVVKIKKKGMINIAYIQGVVFKKF